MALKKPVSPYTADSYYDRLFNGIVAHYCTSPGITQELIDRAILKHSEIAKDWLNQGISARLDADHTVDTLKAIKAQNF